MTTPEHFTDIAVLLDVDGTMSDTAIHMQGLNTRLSQDFPAIGSVLPQIRLRRQAFRQTYGHLSFTEQDDAWQRQYPGTTSHSQLDIYRTFAPEVFDDHTTAAVQEWLQDDRNFGSAEYTDVQPMLHGLRQLGALPVLCTLGQAYTPDGQPGWQTRKIDSAPLLRDLPRYITDALPAGGKGELISRWYDADAGVFRLPVSQQGARVVARSVVMVDDSVHNVRVPEHALGVLVDRTQPIAASQLPEHAVAVQSLKEVPHLVCWAY